MRARRIFCLVRADAAGGDQEFFDRLCVEDCRFGPLLGLGCDRRPVARYHQRGLPRARPLAHLYPAAAIARFLGSALSEDRSITINAFVAEKHGGDARVRLVAAALTVFALTGLIVCETVGIAAIAKPLLSGDAGLVFLVVCAVLATMVACTAVAGNSGAMYAGQLQLGALYFGLFGSLVFLVYLQMSSLSATPPYAILGMIFIAVFCALLPFFRRSRYVDSNIIQKPRRPRAPPAIRRTGAAHAAEDFKHRHFLPCRVRDRCRGNGSVLPRGPHARSRKRRRADGRHACPGARPRRARAVPLFYQVVDL